MAMGINPEGKWHSNLNSTTLHFEVQTKGLIAFSDTTVVINTSVVCYKGLYS